MADDPSHNLLAIVGGSSGAVILAVFWGVWDRISGRRAKAEDRDLAQRQAVLAQADTATSAVIMTLERNLARAEQDATRGRERNEVLEARCDMRESEKDLAWDVARLWKVRAHVLKHELENARTAADGLLASRGGQARPWFDETLPALEAIAMDTLARTERFAAWRKGQIGKAEDDP